MTLSSSIKSNTTDWQAIVFDLDDTLYPEREYVLSGFRAVANWAEANLSIPAEEGFPELKGLHQSGVRGDTFNRWLVARNQPVDNLVPELVGVYREHVPIITPFPGVLELLASLRQRYRLGLLSDGYLSVQQRKLSALGLAGYFDAVVFSDEWGRDAWKPSQQPFAAVLSRLGGLPPRAAVYVADNPLKDFVGARSLGLSTIWIRSLDGEYSSMQPPTPAYTPDVTLTSLHELASMLLC